MLRTTLSLRRLLTFCITCCLLSILTSATWAATWHVSAKGTEAGDGSEKAPFATIPKAIEAAAKATDASEIIIHAGVYRGDNNVPSTGGTEAPTLVIRAATTPDGAFEQVIIDGGQKITEAQVVDEKRGIYYLRFPLANFEPSMWEVESRIRYIYAADRRAVEMFPGSLAPDQDGVIFRTSDGKPPSAHDLGMARDRHGFVVLRPNVTIKGLVFQNFQLHFGVHGVGIEAPNVTVDSCHAWNCYGLAAVGEQTPDARIVNCTARDVATGVKSYGKNTTVDNCRFFRIEDAFVVQENEQDQCGIQFYTSNTQTARGNLCVGFQAGIFIKASGGVLTLENNTVVGPTKTRGDRGIGPNTWRPDSVCRNNVVVGYQEPIAVGDGLERKVTIAGNLVWLASNPKLMEETTAKIKKVNGGENVVGSPLFVEPAKDDYRLSQASIGATLALEKKPVGALGAAAAGMADKTPPTLLLDVLAPAQALGLRTRTYLRKNTWIGGKEPELIEDQLLPSAQMIWLAPAGSVELRVRAEDTLSKVTQVRHRLDNAEWTAAQPLQETLKIALPQNTPSTQISVQVADSAGNWSAPAAVRVTAAAHAPKLLAAPTVVANDAGIVVTFRTDAPCTATLEWNSGAAAETFTQRVTDPEDKRFRFDNDLGLEWTEYTSGPRTDHCLAILTPEKAGQTSAFRVKLGYGPDDQAVVHTGKFTFTGPARTLHVATTGSDVETAGTQAQPFATLQYAVDRALPGDKVLVALGIYTGEVIVHHGGLANRPIRLESAQPWGAVLDGQRQFGTALWLNEISNVQISGFEIRWYRDTCILAHKSENLLVEGCKMWDRHWVKGRPSSNDGVVFFTCKQVALDHNVLFALNSGFRSMETDGFRITNNTGARCFHRVASIAYTDHCYLRNNSFAFGSSYLIDMVMTSAQVEHLDSDYNNLAVYLREDALALARKNGDNVPENELLKAEPGTFYYGVSKGMAGVNSHNADYTHGKAIDFPTITSWREKTGQDKHTVFAHPRYADPQQRDFRLAPDSPNVGKGENGANIGALGVATK